MDDSYEVVVIIRMRFAFANDDATLAPCVPAHEHERAELGSPDMACILCEAPPIPGKLMLCRPVAINCVLVAFQKVGCPFRSCGAISVPTEHNLLRREIEGFRFANLFAHTLLLASYFFAARVLRAYSFADS